MGVKESENFYTRGGASDCQIIDNKVLKSSTRSQNPTDHPFTTTVQLFRSRVARSKIIKASL
jgi:hypothetical protein